MREYGNVYGRQRAIRSHGIDFCRGFARFHDSGEPGSFRLSSLAFSEPYADGHQDGAAGETGTEEDDVGCSRAARPSTSAPAAAPPPTTPAGCHPLGNQGTCYEPGEYCRDDDHGATGIAGDGKAITCEDNDGWRWEPS